MFCETCMFDFKNTFMRIYVYKNFFMMAWEKINHVSLNKILMNFINGNDLQHFLSAFLIM